MRRFLPVGSVEPGRPSYHPSVLLKLYNDVRCYPERRHSLALQCLSQRAMYGLMRCNKQRTSFDSRPSMRETRAIIDEQLRDVGREADTGGHSISCGVKGRNFAIAQMADRQRSPANRRGE